MYAHINTHTHQYLICMCGPIIEEKGQGLLGIEGYRQDSREMRYISNEKITNVF